MAMDGTTLLTSQIGAAAACSYMLNLLQRAKQLPWITQHTPGITMAARALMAGAATLGLSWVWSPATNGGHTLTIAIPSAVSLMLGSWHWFCQYALQHLAGSALGSKQDPVQPPAPALAEK